MVIAKKISEHTKNIEELEKSEQAQIESLQNSINEHNMLQTKSKMGSLDSNSIKESKLRFNYESAKRW